MFITNFFKFSFGSWISAFISFITIPIITLLINPENFGKASIFTLTYNILIQLILFGTDQSFMRFFNEKTINKRYLLLWNSILPSIVVLFSIFIIIYIFWKQLSVWLISEMNYYIIILLCICLFIGLINRFSILIIRMEKKGIIFSSIQIITSLINATVIILYSKLFFPSFYAIIYGSIISMFITSMISIILEKDYWFSKIKLKKVEINLILKYGIPFLPTCLMAMLFESMDKLFIRKFVDFEGLGLYTAAFKIVAVLSVLQNGFSTFWIPISYEHYENNPNDKLFFENSFKYLKFILILCGLLIITGKDIIILLLSKTYKEASTIMPFLVFIPIMYTLSEITYLGINFFKKTYFHIIIFIFLLILCPLFNVIFIPIIGLKGASLSMALSYLIYFSIRTIISNILFPLNLNLFKTYLEFFILFLVAFINTFFINKIIVLILSITSIILFFIININIIKKLLLYLKNNFLIFKKYLYDK